MTDIQLRELRLRKVSEDIMEMFMDKVEALEDEDGLVDILSVWFQVPGAALAVTQGATEDGWLDFSKFLVTCFGDAYKHTYDLTKDT